MELPTDFPYTTFYRSIGPEGSGEVLGAGFMRKPLARADHVDFNPSVYSLCLLLSGKGEYHDQNGNVWPLEQGMYFQRIPGHVHSNYINESGSWVECFIDFGQNLCQTLILIGMINPVRPCGKVHDLSGSMEQVAQLRRNVERYDGMALLRLAPVAIQLLYNIMYGEQEYVDHEKDPFLEKAIAILETDFSKELDLKKACLQNGWGYEWFRKEFRKRTGVSPHRFRIRRKIDKARSLLAAHHEFSLEDIAQILGYCSVYEFSAQFNRYAGVPPGKFRHGTKNSLLSL